MRKNQIPNRKSGSAKQSANVAKQIADLLLRGFNLHKESRFEEASEFYKQILKVDPSNIDALQLLGSIENSFGNSEKAVELFNKALAIRGDVPSIYYNCGNALTKLKRLDEALQCFNKAIALKADYAQAHCNLANTLKDLRRLDDALTSYDKAIALNPNYAEAVYNRANTLQDLSRLDEALACYNKAIDLKPDYAEAYNNRGNTLKELKRLDEALLSYDKAIALKPDYADAYNNRGVLLQKNERLDEALESYHNAILLKPNYAEAYNNRGKTLKELKRLDDALNSYDKAIELNPNYADAHSNRGILLQDLKKFEDALVSYDKAIELNPENADAYNNRGILLQELQGPDEALKSYDKAIELNPENAESYNNRGNVLKVLKRLDDALNSYDKAIELNPNYADAHSNRGILLQDLKKFEDALVSYDKAIEIKQDHYSAYFSKGKALKDLKRFNDSLISYRKAIELKPDYSEALWNLSLLNILLGEYINGWKLYEGRIEKEGASANYYHFKPPIISWRGKESIEGKTILVHSEQGFGDVIQFCRYIPLVKSLGAEIVFEVPKPLLSIVSTLDCDMTVIAKGDPHPQFDAYCPIMSLPYVFKTTVETIPSQVPYLYPDQEKLNNWISRLGTKHRLRVGIVWSGSTAHQNDKNRSIPLDLLTPLFELPVEWHSLQKEYQEADLSTLEQHTQICRHESDLEDFSDTAALVACMDLVISVDTSVAHVAGAIGKPVWIMLPWVSDFRWMLDRNDSPWYPTAKLFRQPEMDDWKSVIQCVKSSQKWSGLFEQIFLIYKWKTCGVTLPREPLAAVR